MDREDVARRVVVAVRVAVFAERQVLVAMHDLDPQCPWLNFSNASGEVSRADRLVMDRRSPPSGSAIFR